MYLICNPDNMDHYGFSNPEAISYKKEGLVKFGRELRQSL
jgi:hypothetical protein